MWQKLVYLSLAGAIGTLARYGLAGMIQRWMERSTMNWRAELLGRVFPWGTLGVNIVGCFLFGLVWSLAETRFTFDSESKLVILVGFMGAFTTFSTFAFESSQMLRGGQWWVLAANVFLHNGLGFIAVWLGFVIGRG